MDLRLLNSAIMSILAFKGILYILAYQISKTVMNICDQLGTFFVNGERACSPFVTKSGHADNPATFAPCVKVYDGKFYTQNSQCSPRGIAL